jgi:LacI family transcriptional regulator
MHKRRTEGAATSVDVAALAGVSQPTVSRALRDDPQVAPATRERVQRAAESLNYVPSQRGRALSTKQTGRIGVVVADLGNPFYQQLLEMLQEELAAASLRMVVFTDGDHGLQAAQLLDGSIDGAVLTTTLVNSPLSDELVARELPVVLLNRHNDTSAADICEADNIEGGESVAAELVALGHTRIGAIFGPADTSTGRDRRRGFLSGLEARGVEPDPARLSEGDFSFKTGHVALAKLMAQPVPPTAVFCANDVIALGAMNAAKALDVDIPGDLTVIGFDDIAMAGWELFSLTTVGQNMDQLARHAVERLVGRIDEPGRATTRIKVGTALVRRATHGPPK